MLENIDNGLMKILPLDYREVFTTSKMILLAKEKINEIVKLVNALENSENEYTNEKIGEVENKITDLTTKLESGNFIKDHTITVDKMDKSFVDDLHALMIRQLSDSCKMVIPTIDNDGHYCFDIPSNWSQIDFNFCDDGHLELICRDE